MKKFKNHHNAQEFPKVYEKKIRPSKTIPDQSYSVREIMERYARGLPIDGTKTPIYHGEENDLPDMAKLDISERYDLIEANKERIRLIQREVRLNEKIKKQEEEKKRRITRYADEEINFDEIQNSPGTEIEKKPKQQPRKKEDNE